MQERLRDDPGLGEVKMPPAAGAGPFFSGWRICWSLFFLLNLISPIRVGWPMCGPAGRVGLIIAVSTYFGLGLMACDGRARWRRALVHGGGLMVFSQMFPLAQICAGATALRAWYFLSGLNGDPLDPGPLSGPGGFVVTGLTGGILLAAALACGLVVDLMFPPPSKPKPKPEPWNEL